MPGEQPNEKPLGSWKEIAVYLGRDVRTVIRWEKSEALPVHRHLHRARSSVYAFPSELDAWRAARVPEPPPAPATLWRRIQPRALFAGLLLVCVFTFGDGRHSVRGAPAQATGLSLTEIFADRRITEASGRISPDGKRFLAVDWSTGNLTVRDMATERPHAVTGAGEESSSSGGFAMTPVWSPDGQRIAYCWFDHGRCELRVRPAGPGPFRGLFGRPDESFFASDWSPDGKQILGILRRSNRQQSVAMVSMDGALTELRRFDTTAVGGPQFSPDGRFVAYDLGRGGSQSIFILALDSRAETAVAEHPSDARFPLWSPDGAHLLFSSNRTGRWDLWAVPMRDGRPAGPAAVVCPDTGQIAAIHGWQNGTQLVFSKRTSFGQLYALPVDGGEPREHAHAPLKQLLGQHMQASWLPDGKGIALLASNRETGAIYLADDGGGDRLRLLEKMPLTWVRLAGWDAARNAVVLSAIHESGAVGFYSLPVSGGVPLRLYEDARMNWATGQMSGSGHRIAYFRRPEAGDGTELCVRDLRRKQQIRTWALTADDSYNGLRFAPDANSVYAAVFSLSRKISRVVRVPLPAGEPVNVVTENGRIIRSLAVSPDGKQLAYSSAVPAAGEERRYELFVVPAGGGTPRHVPTPADHNPWRVAWSADGKHVGYISYETKYRFFRLSGFLPRRVR